MIKVLVSSFSCGPGLGSEPGIGWNTICHLAQDTRMEIWAVVEAGAMPRILEHLEKCPMPNVHFIPHGWEWWSKLMSTVFTQSISWNSYYYIWQITCLILFRRLHKQQRFDVCHHVTYGKHSAPSMLAALGIPFIWGPVGGAESVPLTFFRHLSLRSRLYEGLRLFVIRASEFNPLLRWTAAQSAIALGTTQETAQSLYRLGAPHVQVLSAVALTEDEMNALDAVERTGTTNAAPQMLFVGNLIPYKGVDYAIRALAASGAENARLKIIGTGSLRPFLERLTHDLGLSQRVEFLGQRPREDVLRLYREADGLLFPSLHDSGGYAVLEAMAASLPVICFDLGGPGHFIDESCGWKVAAPDPQQALRGLAEAIACFATDPAARESKGRAARERVLARFNWVEHGHRLRDVIKRLAATVPRGTSSFQACQDA